MSSNNYLNTIEQIAALGRFGADSFKAGQLDRETKDKIRKEIYSFVARAKNSEGDGRIGLSESLVQSRNVLEDYVHDFGNPKQVPDVHFDYIDILGILIKAVDIFEDEGNDSIDGMPLSNIISILSDEWVRIASKILRLAFQVRDPPLQLPNTGNLQPPKKEDVFN